MEADPNAFVRTSLTTAHEDLGGRFANADSIYAALEPRPDGAEPVRLVRETWIVERARLLRECETADQRRSCILPRRQEMPEAAFISMDELKLLEASLRGAHNRMAGSSRVAVVGVSYCWRTADHPDPTGETLLLLASELTRIREEQAMDRRIGGPLAQWPVEVALFIDWCSLFQKDASGERTAVEHEAFREALGSMELWYAHQLTSCFLLRGSGEGTSRGYDQRGWCAYESTVASILKMRWPTLWDPIFVVGACDEVAVRQPPPSAESFAELLETKEFTNGADRAVVVGMYATTLARALGEARQLVYVRCGWGDAELAVLATTLHLCTQLRVLSLGHNRIGDAGLAAFSAAIRGGRVLPQLAALSLGFNAYGTAGLAALGTAFESGALPQLETLGLSNCPTVTPAAFEAFCDGLRSRMALPRLTLLSLQGTDVGRTGLHALTDALWRGALIRIAEIVVGHSATMDLRPDDCSAILWNAYHGIRMKLARPHLKITTGVGGDQQLLVTNAMGARDGQGLK